MCTDVRGYCIIIGEVYIVMVRLEVEPFTHIIIPLSTKKAVCLPVLSCWHHPAYLVFTTTESLDWSAFWCSKHCTLCKQTTASWDSLLFYTGSKLLPWRCIGCLALVALHHFWFNTKPNPAPLWTQIQQLKTSIIMGVVINSVYILKGYYCMWK